MAGAALLRGQGRRRSRGVGERRGRGRHDLVRPRPAGDGVGQGQRPDAQAARRVRAGGARRRRSTRTCSRTRRRASRSTCARRGTATLQAVVRAAGRTATGCDIVFTVKYGPLYRVAGVRFEGADAVGAADLAPLMSTGRGAAVRAGAARRRPAGRPRGATGSAGSPTRPCRRRRRARAGRPDRPARRPSSSSSRIAEGPQTLVVGGRRVAGAIARDRGANWQPGSPTRAGGPLFGPDVDADRDRILAQVSQPRLPPRAVSTRRSSCRADRTAAQVRFAMRGGAAASYVDHVLVVGNNRDR
ncbi:MAG: hypothetical protein MZV64_13515 [Ignavibacteriales bacterium]|nr:hypothetical protein [Ignavibacteriales bacterium]